MSKASTIEVAQFETGDMPVVTIFKNHPSIPVGIRKLPLSTPFNKCFPTTLASHSPLVLDIAFVSAGFVYTTRKSGPE